MCWKNFWNIANIFEMENRPEENTLKSMFSSRLNAVAMNNRSLQLKGNVDHMVLCRNQININFWSHLISVYLNYSFRGQRKKTL